MRKLLFFLLTTALGLSGCISISTPTPANVTPGFATATFPATNTPFSQPVTGIATASTATTPSARLTAPANCKTSAVLLQDVTIPDDTNVAAGSKFTKTWEFLNNGTCPWTGFTIVFASGDRMGSPDSAPVPDTAPKSKADISVDLVAPATDGAYTGFFELHDAHDKVIPIGIFNNFWVKITVGDVSITQPAISTATPAPSNGTPLSQPKGPLSCNYVNSPSYPGEIANLINQARQKAGLSSLTINSRLAAAAQGHSIDMTCYSLLSHTGSDGSSPQQRIAAAGYSASYSEEIIYAGGYPQDAFNWWMNDQIHHDAILNTHVTEMGVGYAYSSDSTYGGYFTVDFGSQ